jgi:folate-binding protein YgfZ
MGDAMPRGTEADWQAGEIIGGVARIEAATVEAHVPQTLNYDLTGHINFNKGCYTGQEVVARLHYRGKPKHRTRLAELPAGTHCAAGAPVFDAGSGNKAGSIVNAAETSSGTFALVETAVDERSDSLRLGAAEGIPLSLGELPYAVLGD